jgi:hypothetical protein
MALLGEGAVARLYHVKCVEVCKQPVLRMRRWDFDSYLFPLSICLVHPNFPLRLHDDGLECGGGLAAEGGLMCD